MTLVKVNHPAKQSFDGLINDIFNEFPATFGKTFREDVFSFPPVNIIENATAYQLQVAVPGFDKADFTIKLENNILTLSADKKAAEQAADQKTIRREFSQKGFKRSFTIDEKIEGAAIEAKYEAGILTLTLPKKEIARASTKEITIS